MAFTYDLASVDSNILAISRVRWRITDKDPDFAIFDDDEIATAIVMEAGVIKRAAALCLETIAADEALVQKVIKILQLSTNGPAVAAELRANAKLLRDQAADEVTGEDSATFDIAEWVVDDFTLRQRLINEGLRAS